MTRPEGRTGDPRETELVVTRIHEQLVANHLEFLACQAKAQESYLAACAALQARLLEGRPATMPSPADGPLSIDWEMSFERDPWVVDHDPVATVPVLPLTYELEMMCQAAAARFPGQKLTTVVSMESRRWAPFIDGTLRGCTRMRVIGPGRCDLELQIVDPTREGHMTAAVCRLTFGDEYPTSLDGFIPDLVDARPAPDPYRTGELFHGPSLQLMTELVQGVNGATFAVDAGSRGVPRGLVHPGMLDASLHGVPFFDIVRWYPDLAAGKVAFPYRIQPMTFFRPFPDGGRVTVDVRMDRIEHGALPVLKFWLRDATGLLAVFELAIALVPAGPLAGRTPEDWKRFMRATGAVEGLTLTRSGEDGRTLALRDLKDLEWIPGTLARVYGVGAGVVEPATALAIRDHLGHVLTLHPSRVTVDAGSGRCRNLPFNDLRIEARIAGDRIATQHHETGPLDRSSVDAHWKTVGLEPSLLTDIMKGLLRQFVRRFVVEDPVALAGESGRPVLYLANHQVGIESILFCILAGTLGRTRCLALTHEVQQGRIAGTLGRLAEQLIGPDLPVRALSFDPQDPDSLFRRLDEFHAICRQDPTSLYVTVEGIRALQAGHVTQRLSSVFIDLALTEDLAIVPVKFVGGLPREPLTKRLDFPYQFGQQDYFIGRPIEPTHLRSLPYMERRRHVLDRINDLGPQSHLEEPLPPDAELGKRVSALKNFGFPELPALLVECLKRLEDPCEGTRRFLQDLESGKLFTQPDSDPIVRVVLSLMSGKG